MHKPSKKNAGIIILFVTGLLVFAWIFVWPRQHAKVVSVVITNASWERIIFVESLRPQKQSKLCKEMPEDAYQIQRFAKHLDSLPKAYGKDCPSEILSRDNDSVNLKKNCIPVNGNSPELANHCEFLVNRWTTVRDVRSQGKLTDEIRWPQVRLRQMGDCVGCEREGKREDLRFVDFKVLDWEETGVCNISTSNWGAVQIGKKLQIKVGKSDTKISCHNLEEELP